ncbi:MAG: pyridoxal phosphate-dependent aminotransferase [Candidatus Aminicenantes bacterium]|nr:pyridoxal phosphate-dependent aminotransferase [Candidatus Aminicenantes bacterium]
MNYSLIGESIRESATLKLNSIASALRAKGEPVIHLGGGEPKSKAPFDAIISAAGILNSGEVRYTPADGIPDLKKAIINYTEEFYGRSVSPENVIASSGAKQALMVCLQAILNPHDEVIFPAPYWVSYPEMVKLCGAVPVSVLASDGSFHPRLQDIEKKVTPATKAVIINSPNNPTGIMYSETFISEIVGFCEKKGLYLIMDDIYHRLIFDGKKPISCYQYGNNKSENSRLVVINGVSKQYAMTGFRIGWAVANKKLRKIMANIQAHQSSGPSVVLQRAAIGALNGSQSSVESLRLSLENNRKVMMDQLNAFNGVKVTQPDGTFYCFVDFNKFDRDSTKMANFLLEKVFVVTVPGVEFGLDGFLRLSTCGSIKEIIEGVGRIKWAFDPEAADELYIGERKLVRDWV